MKLYVGNLSYETKDADLEKAFEAFGRVDSAIVLIDKLNGRSKGFGFVEMASKDEGLAAIEGLNEKELNGRTLTVNEARPKTDHKSGFSSKSGFSGNRGGKGGFSGSRGPQGGKGGQSGNRGRQGGGRNS